MWLWRWFRRLRMKRRMWVVRRLPLAWEKKAGPPAGAEGPTNERYEYETMMRKEYITWR